MELVRRRRRCRCAACSRSTRRVALALRLVRRPQQVGRSASISANVIEACRSRRRGAGWRPTRFFWADTLPSVPLGGRYARTGFSRAEWQWARADVTDETILVLLISASCHGSQGARAKSAKAREKCSRSEPRSHARSRTVGAHGITAQARSGPRSSVKSSTAFATNARASACRSSSGRPGSPATSARNASPGDIQNNNEPLVLRVQRPTSSAASGKERP